MSRPRPDVAERNRARAGRPRVDARPWWLKHADDCPSCPSGAHPFYAVEPLTVEEEAEHAHQAEAHNQQLRAVALDAEAAS